MDDSVLDKTYYTPPGITNKFQGGCKNNPKSKQEVDLDQTYYIPPNLVGGCPTCPNNDITLLNGGGKSTGEYSLEAIIDIMEIEVIKELYEKNVGKYKIFLYNISKKYDMNFINENILKYEIKIDKILMKQLLLSKDGIFASIAILNEYIEFFNEKINFV